ncbi:MAG: hydrogenase iron-sulfur subunit [candidate division WOR-3 bacterium]|nr:MAG: hydrogenase iron-sulfur subunit [candidate division WOR-3 bacterium]
MSGQFEPKIAGFFCKWCTSAGADLAGTTRLKYPPNVIPVTMFCSSRVDPQYILQAFRDGADGVIIGGCHPGDCHYQAGNYKTMKRIILVKRLMQQMSIDEGRLRLEWISAAEGGKFARIIHEFTEEIRNLGPLQLAQAVAPGHGAKG